MVLSYIALHCHTSHCIVIHTYIVIHRSYSSNRHQTCILGAKTVCVTLFPQPMPCLHSSVSMLSKALAGREVKQATKPVPPTSSSMGVMLRDYRWAMQRAQRQWLMAKHQGQMRRESCALRQQ